MAAFWPVKNGDSWLVWQRGTEAWPAGEVAAGGDGTGVLAAGVLLVPGVRVAPAPGALALPQPTASAARHAAADAAAKRKVIMFCSRRARDYGMHRSQYPQPRAAGAKGSEPMVLAMEAMVLAMEAI
jgi:hypothetical protein